ncbi:MAG: beta-ketoacyl-ACP synthase [Rhodospirillales bacterium]
MRRVVVTGMSGITALGTRWPEIQENMKAGKTATRYMPEWERYSLHTKLAAPLEGIDLTHLYPRKKTRTMGPISLMAVRASEMALENAGLIGDKVLSSGRTGVAYGSSWGSVEPVMDFAELMTTGSSHKLSATSYVRMMSHTTAVNIGMFFGLTGRVIPTSSACTSGSQAIGYAYETIRMNRQDVMIAGGAEELSVSEAAVFDTLYATSCENAAPERSPRPFDRDRDGLVIGEGSTSFVLEDYDRAKARGATIYAEVVGFGTNADGNHITQPQASTMEQALRLALEDADLTADAIDFVSAHGTATDSGDAAESRATFAVFGKQVPIHALKSYFGHTLGACGAMESWLAIEMMRSNWFAPTANLVNPDEKCADLDYVFGSPRVLAAEYVMNNNFAFGGINTSLIFRHPE